MRSKTCDINPLLQVFARTAPELLTKVFTFFALALYIKNEILLVQPPMHPQHIAPRFIPLDVVKLLSDACGILPVEVERVWSAIKDAVWMCNPLDDKAIQTLFREHGTDKGFRM
jgi:hypothetical protein